MAPEKAAQPETQDQSIKSRKRQMYEAEVNPALTDARAKNRSVADYLRETPATPLSGATKAGLWGAGAVVLATFAMVVVLKSTRGKPATSDGLPRDNFLAARGKVSPAPVAVSPGPPAVEPAKADTGPAAPGKADVLKRPDLRPKSEQKKETALPSPAVPEKVGWSVTADPAGTGLDIPAGSELSLPIPATKDGTVSVLFPGTPSPVVALGDNHDEAEAREVWDLHSKRKLGVLRGLLGAQPPYALSPDGGILAARFVRPVNQNKDKNDGDQNKDKEKEAGIKTRLAIWSFKTGQEVKQIGLKDPAVDYLDFAGPDTLIVAARGASALQLWSMEKGKKTGELAVPGPFDVESLALSPGRKYLALVIPGDSLLRVYDLSAGKAVGEATLPKPKSEGTWKCLGMTFANDGKALAGAFDVDGKTRVVSWEIASAKVMADHLLDETEGVRRAAGEPGRPVEWLADGEGWLLFGQTLIDRQSGRRIWSLPLGAPDFPPGPRRMVEGDRVLFVVRPSRNQAAVLRAVSLPADEITSARRIVRAGGSAVDAVLPALRPVDLGSTRSVPDPAASWSAAPDPLAKLPKPLLGRPIALKNKLNEVQQVVCSAAEGAQAAVAITTLDRNEVSGNVLAAGQTTVLERYDLTNGKRISQSPLPAVCEPAGLSPEGGRILLRDAEKRERLDVYTSAGGELKHLVGWRPYEKDSGADRSIAWTAFLDQHRVLTLSAAGKLILWAVPDCRAVYVLKDALQGTAVLSPNRKLLAGVAAGSIRVFDPVTGRRLGEAPAPSSEGGDKPGLIAAAFRPDGQQLACLLAGGVLARVDVATGKVLSEFPCPAAPGPWLDWCGPRHVLVNNQSLIDLDRQWKVWHYVGGRQAIGSPDGRHWAAYETFSNAPAYLGGITLPEKNLEKIVALVADKKAPALVRKGSSVTLRLEAAGPPRNPQAWQKSVYDQFAGQLKGNDVRIEDGQPVSLVIKVDEIQTPERFELRWMFPALGDTDTGKKVVPFRVLELEVFFVDGAGKITYEPKQTISLRDVGAITLPPGEKDPEAFLRTLLWSTARQRLSAVRISAFVARSPDGLVKFPGNSSLGSALK